MSSTVRNNHAGFNAGGTTTAGLVVRDSTFESNGAQGVGAIANGWFTGHGEAVVVNTLSPATADSTARSSRETLSR